MSTDAFDDTLTIGDEADNIESYDRPKPGWYFCAITGADTEKDLKKLGLSFSILSGNVDGQDGKTFDRDIFWMTQKGAVNAAIVRLLAVSAICRRENLRGYKMDKKKFAKDLIGRLVVVHLELEPSRDDPAKKYLSIANFNMGIYAPNEAEVAKHGVLLDGKSWEYWLKTFAGGDTTFNLPSGKPPTGSGNGQASARQPAVDPNAL